MKFTSKEDIAAPADAVFAALSDFRSFENLVRRRGGKIARTDTMTTTGPGMSWDVEFGFRGKPRQAEAVLRTYTPSEMMQVDIQSRALTAVLVVSVMPLGRSRSRVRLELDLEPRTLAARLVMQSMRLTKGKLNERFRENVGGYLRGLEARLAPGVKGASGLPGKPQGS